MLESQQFDQLCCEAEINTVFRGTKIFQPLKCKSGSHPGKIPFLFLIQLVCRWNSCPSFIKYRILSRVFTSFYRKSNAEL